MEIVVAPPIPVLCRYAGDKGRQSNAPLMNEEQIISCQQGNMEVLSSYLGSGNMVVMACVYKG